MPHHVASIGVGAPVVAILVPFGFFCMVAAIVIVPLILRHRQRMAAIAKGVPLAAIAWGIHGELKPPEAHLKRGLILSFVGGGILVFFGISILSGLRAFGNDPIIMLIGIILLAIGIAELIYYRLTKHKAAAPTEKETANDAEKKTPQIDADKDKNL